MVIREDLTSHVPSSLFTNESDDSVQKMKNIRALYCISRDSQSDVNESFQQQVDNQVTNSKDSSLQCKMCNNHSVSPNLDSFIILSCNHIFHVNCLAQQQFQDSTKHQLIDTDFFASQKCTVCSKPIGVEELIFVHSKYLTNTNTSMLKHQESIQRLEAKLKGLKDELRTCYEYKQRIDFEKEKSKQILSCLTTMM